MGYPLPPGDASEDELECCIVFYPKRDAYRRALMGSLDYLATWIAWERDSEKRGQDAAASWKLANIQTWECTNMGYCDDLATTLQALLAATQALECCGEQDFTDGEQYTDDVVDGVGDVPQNIIDAGYATGPTDWAGFDDYKCMISHLAVDHIESFFREILPHINASGIVVGGVGVVGALLGAILVIVGLPISAGIILALGSASAIWYWITEYGQSAVQDVADGIATNHDALACAIYNGDGVGDAIDDFNAKVDDLFGAIDAVAIKAVGFEPQLRAMYSGRYDQEDIAQRMDDLGYELVGYACDCVEPEPPPSGYELVNAGYLELEYDTGCVDTGSVVDPETGIVTLSFTVNTGTWILHHHIQVTSVEETGWLKHGWVVDLISYSGASNVPSYRGGGTSFSPPVVINSDIYPGDSWAGYNRDLHGGAEWDDWENSYDYAKGHNQAGPYMGSQIRTAGGVQSAHEIVYRLRILRPV
jgi:hypothetical protein